MPPQDNGVRFENQGDEYGPAPVRSGGFDLRGMLVRWGLVSSTQEAEYVLIAVAVVALLIAAFFFFRGTGNSAPPPAPVAGSPQTSSY